ncbi:unnamed protein product, partial [Meganyctiphanes norvegica]
SIKMDWKTWHLLILGGGVVLTLDYYGTGNIQGINSPLDVNVLPKQEPEPEVEYHTSWNVQHPEPEQEYKSGWVVPRPEPEPEPAPEPPPPICDLENAPCLSGGVCKPLCDLNEDMAGRCPGLMCSCCVRQPMCEALETRCSDSGVCKTDCGVHEVLVGSCLGSGCKCCSDASTKAG